MNIGFIGLGVMGRPMALHLIKAGNSVSVYARRPAAAAPLAAAGATLCSTPAELASRSNVVVTMVTATADVEEVLLELLGSANLCSRRWVYEQYDQLVQAGTVLRPGGDAAVVRVPETSKGLAMSTDCNPRFCSLDPYLGALHAVAEAARNVAVTGARPLAVTNCLNFGSPERAESMWQFVESIRGLGDACREAVLAATGLAPDRVFVLAPGTLPRTSSGKLRRQETLRCHLAGELTAPDRVTPLLLAGAMARSAVAYARTRLEKPLTPRAPLPEGE